MWVALMNYLLLGCDPVSLSKGQTTSSMWDGSLSRFHLEGPQHKWTAHPIHLHLVGKLNDFIFSELL